ncbi:MAG: hypothetical protein IIY02_00865 [Firmicutes bacterium]|nr:hypothetical protein [Bacillota bacterium]
MTTATVLKKLITFFLFLAFFFLAAASVKIIYEKWQDHHIDANTLFFTSLEECKEWNSYRYTLSSELKLNNGAKTKTVLRGEQDQEGNMHLFGEIMDTEMEAYQFGDDHYRFISTSQKWKRMADSPLSDNGVLRMVIEPKRNFEFSDTISVDYEGTVREDGEKYYRFIVVPKEGFHIADTYFTDFKYRIDIHSETKQITNALITAVSPTKGENKLTCAVHFFDINEDFLLKPPI